MTPLSSIGCCVEETDGRQDDAVLPVTRQNTSRSPGPHTGRSDSAEVQASKVVKTIARFIVHIPRGYGSGLFAFCSRDFGFGEVKPRRLEGHALAGRPCGKAIPASARSRVRFVVG